MSERQIFRFLNRFWLDVQTTEFYWTILLLALLIALSWWLAICWHKNHLSRAVAKTTWQIFGSGGLKRVVPPLIALVFISATHKTLQVLNWTHLSLFVVFEILILTWTLIRAFVYILHCVFPQSLLLRRSERQISFFLWCVPLLETLGVTDFVVDTLESIEFNAGKQKLNLWILLHGIVTVCFTVLIAMWLASLIERRLMSSATMDRNLREVLSRVMKAVLFTIALLLSLSLVGIDITTLSVFSGAFAVGLGFGLQKIASNYVSGFIILLDRSIRIGNLVALDDKISGTISQITTRYTVLRMLNGTEIIIPNEYLVSNMVRNLSFTDSKVSLTISLQVGYNTDFDYIMPLMTETVKAHPRALASPAPSVLVTGFADSGINIDLNFWLADPELGTGRVRSEISLEILKLFRTHNIEIPFPQREIRILNA